MNTQTMKIYANVNAPSVRTPVTARGRAMYTTAWFLHGIAPQRDYDNQRINIRDVAC